MTTTSPLPSIPTILDQLQNPQPWQLAALLQDNLVWNSFLDRGFLTQVSRRLTAARAAGLPPTELSPATLALDALEYPGLIHTLRTTPAAALPESLVRLLEEGDTSASESSRPVQALRTAGIHALGLHQQLTHNPASAPVWEAVFEELPDCATALACLYGMLPKPAILLTALLKTAPKHPRALSLLCHVLLSNPLNVDALQSLFQRLLVQAGLFAPTQPAAPGSTALEIVDILSELRPDLGAQLAGWLAAEMPQAGSIETIHPATALPALLAQARLHQLNGSPEQAAADLASAATQANLLLSELQTVNINELRRSPSDTAQAVQQLDQIMAADEPRSHPWIVRQRTNHLNNLAAHLLQAGRAPQALEAARLLQERSPGNATVHFLLGASLLAQSPALGSIQQHGWLAAAIRNLELAAALDPHSTEKMRRLAAAYAATGNFEDGLAIHERIIAEAELRQEATLLADILALGQCAVQAGSLLRAIEVADQALALLEGCPNAAEQTGQVYSLLGKAHQLMGDLATAVENLKLAVQYNPQECTAWLALAACAQAAGNEAGRIETLTTAVQAIPQAPELHLALGIALFDQELLTEAQESLSAAHDLCASDCEPGLRQQVALAFGRTLLALNHQAQAGSLLAEAHTLQPTDPAAAGLYGRWLLANGQAARAAAVLEIAASDPAINPTLVVDYASALLGSDGAPQRAILSLEAVLPRLESNHEDEALSLLGDAYSRLGENQKAFDLFRAVLLRSPHLDQQKKGALSRGFGCAALSLSSTQPDLMEVAHAALQDAAALCPDHAPTRRFLAEAAWANGLDNEAWIAAKASLEIDGSLAGAMWFADQILRCSETAPSIFTDTGSLKKGVRFHFPDLVKHGIKALRACKQDGGLPNPALIRLATLFQLASQPTNALGALKAIQTSPSAEAGELEQTAQLYLALEEPQCALKSLILAAARAATPHQKATLYAQQSDLHAGQGQRQEAAAAMNAAIEASPYDMGLHIRLVKLLTSYNQYDQADQAAQRALGACSRCNDEPGPDLTTAALYSQLAELQLATGRLVQSYAHATHAIEIFSAAAPLNESDSEAAGSAFAAGVQAAHGLLLPGKAAALVRNPMFPLNAVSEPLNTALHCLASQQALTENAELEAVEHLTPILSAGRSAAHPWAKILQALLLLRSKRDEDDYYQASQLLESVFTDFTGSASPLTRAETRCPVALNAYKEAVLTLSNKPATWDRLTVVFQALATAFSPASPGAVEANPLASLLLVQVLVARAEYRQLCVELQAVHSAPLPDERESALCFELIQTVEAALLSARQEAAALPAENLACDLDENAWEPATQTLERWKARAAAVFGEPLPAAWVTWDPIQLSAPGMQADAAACLAHLRTHAAERPQLAGARFSSERPLPLAHQFAQAHPDAPLVQIQAALLVAGSRLENARTFANRAMTAASAVGEKGPSASPLAPLAHATYAQITRQLNLPELALQSYQAALALLPEEPRWRLACATLLSESTSHTVAGSADSAFSQAAAHLEEAVRLEPGFALHSLALSKLLTTMPHADPAARPSPKDAASVGGSVRRQALRTLERASRLFPDDAAIWLALAQAQAFDSFGIRTNTLHLQQAARAAGAKTRPAGSSAAEACARRSVELAHKADQPDIEAAGLCLNGQLALHARDAETAYRAGRQATHLLHSASDPQMETAVGDSIAQLRAAAVLIQVEALEMLDRFSDALELLENHLGTQLSENSAGETGPLPLRLKQANLVSKVHGPQAGIERLESLQTQAGDPCPQVEAALAFDLAAAGRVEEAIQQARQSLAHMAAPPTSTPPGGLGNHLLPAASPAELHALVGRLLASQGQLDQAVHHYSNAIKADPSCPDAYLEMADVYNRQRQYNRALQALEQATKIAPQDPRAYHLAGVVYREGRDYPRAAELLRRAADLDPENAEIRRHLLAVMAAGFFSNTSSGVDHISAPR